ncbi:hypothetical protein SUGI_0768570 [Cryptomeria japonica]|nr:hypothetical protein SUGI_0768570 [Cryptomeria japonica]
MATRVSKDKVISMEEPKVGPLESQVVPEMVESPKDEGCGVEGNSDQDHQGNPEELVNHKMEVSEVSGNGGTNRMVSSPLVTCNGSGIGIMINLSRDPQVPTELGVSVNSSDDDACHLKDGGVDRNYGMNGEEFYEGESKTPFTIVKPKNRRKTNPKTLSINTRSRLKVDCGTTSRGAGIPSLIQSRGRVSQAVVVDGLQRTLLEMGISGSSPLSK